jgi:hypothetical protein
LQDHGDSIRALLGDGLEHLAIVFAVINPAPNLIRDHEDLVVYGGTSIVTGRGEIPCPV